MSERSPASVPKFRRLRHIATSLALVFYFAGSATADEPEWTPDEAVLAAIAACENVRPDAGVLNSLCRNRNDIAGLIGVCQDVEPEAARVDAATLSRWDQRNAPYLRWVASLAAAEQSEPDPGQEEASAFAWPPVEDLTQAEDVLKEVREMTPERRKDVCRSMRQAVDAGEFDLAPPTEA